MPHPRPLEILPKILSEPGVPTCARAPRGLGGGGGGRDRGRPPVRTPRRPGQGREAQMTTGLCVASCHRQVWEDRGTRTVSPVPDFLARLSLLFLALPGSSQRQAGAGQRRVRQGPPLTRSRTRGPRALLTRGLCLRRGARGARPGRAASLLIRRGGSGRVRLAEQNAAGSPARPDDVRLGGDRGRRGRPALSAPAAASGVESPTRGNRRPAPPGRARPRRPSPLPSALVAPAPLRGLARSPGGAGKSRPPPRTSQNQHRPATANALSTPLEKMPKNLDSMGDRLLNLGVRVEGSAGSS
ncbi:uncharacterized protein LOC128596361 [Nycticebus coucang]|uniref:uncharacterized protein LOC128596361 n=1 Tax=Nycticebus coucang TaxID=9470 RepID=UPI00234D00F0|nr:uncharacterized protein LOC128596361 [Nycticebus coucang]